VGRGTDLPGQGHHALTSVKTGTTPDEAGPRSSSDLLAPHAGRHTQNVSRAVIAVVVNGKARATIVVRAHPSPCEPPWRPVVVIGHGYVNGAADLRAYLHLLHLLTSECQTAVDCLRRGAERGTRGKRVVGDFRPDRDLPQELPVPDGALPPVPLHRGAEHFNCDRRPSGRIEENGTTGRIRRNWTTEFRIHRTVAITSL
jgi:hypothetical protein